MSESKRIVFISGNFNVLHAGHIRLFAFARNFAEHLVVGVLSDRHAEASTFVEESLRLEAVKTNSWVSEAILIDQPINEVLERLKPEVVVKGREFEHQNNIEAEVINRYGGRLMFGSSELPLSSVEMIRHEVEKVSQRGFTFPSEYLNRHGISLKSLQNTIETIAGLKVCVVGDLIVDEYVSCQGLGMSQEDPSLVVTPVDTRRFLGGAGIVAAHAAVLGAHARLISVIGDDECGKFVTELLRGYGVDWCPQIDDGRPTTLKRRYRAEGKTLLRVSHLAQSSISPEIQESFYRQFIERIEGIDLIVFSDFNYGCLPTTLVKKLIRAATDRGIMCIADSQSSSQIGDIARFKKMTLIAATEREVRISLRDNDGGLTMIAEKLRAEAEASYLIIKLGSDGVLVHAPSSEGRMVTSQFPALNHYPVDPAGAGDSMLITAGLALALNSSPWEAAALGSLAAALQVGRLGNRPISKYELLSTFPSVAH